MNLTAQDIAVLVGYCLGSWGMGYCFGLLVTAIKKGFEKIV
jgi:hypothetical protein